MAVKAEKYLSMAELAGMLSLPESTARYYCKRFAGYLPGAGEGRRRRYAPEAKSVLEFIVAAMQRNKNAMLVEMLLKEALAQGEPALRGASAGGWDAADAMGTGPEAAALAHFSAQGGPPGYGPDLPAGSWGAPFFGAALGGADEASSRIMLFMERQSEALTQIAATLEMLAGQGARPRSRKGRAATALHDETPALRDMHTAGQPGLGKTEEALRQEVQALRQEIKNAEKIHQQDLEQLRKWLAILGESVAQK